MITIKFDLCAEVFYFNTASCQIEKGVVMGAKVIPTGVSKTEEGKDKLDGFVVLYSLQDGPVLAEPELFASEQECWEYYKTFFAQ